MQKINLNIIEEFVKIFAIKNQFRKIFMPDTFS